MGCSENHRCSSSYWQVGSFVRLNRKCFTRILPGEELWRPKPGKTQSPPESLFDYGRWQSRLWHSAKNCSRSLPRIISSPGRFAARAKPTAARLEDPVRPRERAGGSFRPVGGSHVSSRAPAAGRQRLEAQYPSTGSLPEKMTHSRSLSWACTAERQYSDNGKKWQEFQIRIY